MHRPIVHRPIIPPCCLLHQLLLRGPQQLVDCSAAWIIHTPVPLAPALTNRRRPHLPFCPCSACTLAHRPHHDEPEAPGSLCASRPPRYFLACCRDKRLHHVRDASCPKPHHRHHKHHHPHSRGLKMPAPDCYSGSYADPEACCQERRDAGLEDPTCPNIVGNTCASVGPTWSDAFKRCCRQKPYDSSCSQRREPQCGDGSRRKFDSCCWRKYKNGTIRRDRSCRRWRH